MKNNLKITVNGMSCGHCEKSVSEAVKSIKDVTDAVASVQENSVNITFEGNLDIEEVKRRIRDVGYEPVD